MPFFACSSSVHAFVPHNCWECRTPAATVDAQMAFARKVLSFSGIWPTPSATHWATAAHCSDPQKAYCSQWCCCRLRVVVAAGYHRAREGEGEHWNVWEQSMFKQSYNEWDYCWKVFLYCFVPQPQDVIRTSKMIFLKSMCFVYCATYLRVRFGPIEKCFSKWLDKKINHHSYFKFSVLIYKKGLFIVCSLEPPISGWNCFGPFSLGFYQKSTICTVFPMLSENLAKLFSANSNLFGNRRWAPFSWVPLHTVVSDIL